ncbi:winged helix-turn-helix domain-containing protein [Cryobacterium tepidiphilum]|uniref:ArsR family transcriptional regulator n=1 Tax=Cryobacterium tepidiphilum TaxID=2486026 RepID=A0A3M8L1P6_9MICO|nr:helix-turn-helix domain-containing protein [Cryobacterium tepidiphilum]RNE59195.1 ArsR family transcriptional regulator [Cryobacterium tepidiphilum]
MTEPTIATPRVAALTSAKQMRALAHPLRMQVLGELRVNGPRTVGALSELFGEAPGTLSYHLGKLAEFGFVEEAPELAADRRERWWRSAHEVTDISPPAADAAPAERNASAALRHQVIDVYAALLHHTIDVAQPREWEQAATSGDTIAYLTAAQLAEASAELQAVAAKWQGRGDRDAEGAAPVQVIVHAFRRP